MLSSPSCASKPWRRPVSSRPSQQQGKLRSPLHGIPIALKDNIDTAGVRTSAASAVFADRVPADWSLDHCGPMTRTVEDAAVMLQALAGYDRLDVSSVEHAIPDYTAALRQPVSALRLGIPRAPYFDLLDEDIRKAVEDAITVLAKMTNGSREVTLPSTEDEAFARSSVPKLYPTRAVPAVRASGAARKISKLRAFSTPTGFESHPRLQPKPR